MSIEPYGSRTLSYEIDSIKLTLYIKINVMCTVDDCSLKN